MGRRQWPFPFGMSRVPGMWCRRCGRTWLLEGKTVERGRANCKPRCSECGCQTGSLLSEGRVPAFRCRCGLEWRPYPASLERGFVRCRDCDYTHILTRQDRRELDRFETPDGRIVHRKMDKAKVGEIREATARGGDRRSERYRASVGME